MTTSHAALLHAAAAARPAAAAITVDGGPVLSYGDWQRRGVAAARGIRAAGVAPGDRVALLFDTERWTDCAVAYAAVVQAGAIAMPLSSELSSLELVRVLRHSRAAAVVAPRDLAPADLVVPLLAAESLEEHMGSGAPDDGGGRDPVEILHVSRQLAAPVVQERSHATVLARCRLAVDAAGGAGVLLHWWPVGAAAGQDALWSALQGLPIRVLTEFDARAVCDLIGGGGASLCSLHPASALALLDTCAATGESLAGLHGLVLAGGRVPESLRRRFASQVPGTRVVNADPPAPVTAEPPVDPGAVPVPRPEVQAAVAAAWRRMLGAETGARSIPAPPPGGVRAARVVRLVEDALDVRVPLQAFLDAPTQDGLCAVVGTMLADRGGVAAIDGDQSAPAAFSQEGMVWYECFAPGCQNLPGLARRFQGRLDVAALSRALDEVVRRHPPLRSTFATAGARLLQVVHPPSRVPLDVIDLSGLNAAERAAEVEARVSGAGAAPFDLVEGPLFVPSLLRLADDEHVLVIRTHHSVFDDWSVGVFRRQLAELYAACSEGRDPQLPAQAVGFATFAREQRRRLAGDAGADEIDYWRVQLSGSPLTTQLPVQDPAAPPGTVQRPGGPLTATLSDADRAAVQALARRERTTVFTVLLAAFAALTSRVTGREDLLLSTVVAGRNRVELEPLIGCFTKKVPLRLDLRGDPAFGDIVSRTRSALLGSLAHQDLPFEAVVQEVLGARAQAHGLVPHLDVLVQGVTPRQELVLPAVDSAGFDTSTRATRAHFMAGAEPPRGDPGMPWGAGMYLGTFVILSVATDDDASCTLRGAFDNAAGAWLLAGFQRTLSVALADPDRRLSELGTAPWRQASPAAEDLDGFAVDTARVAAELSRCLGVRVATARIVRGGDSGARLEADIVPASDPPGAASLRTCLWRRLPGYAWPAAMHPATVETGSDPDVLGTVLGALWAEVLGIEQCLPDDNYWQDFSFLEALARARDAGLRVPGAAVTRNRTLRTLATALAADRGAKPVPALPGPA